MPLPELQSLLVRHTGALSGIASTAIPGVLVSRIVGAPHEEEPNTGTILAVVAQGTKRLTVGSAVHDYGAGQYLVASVDLPVSGQFVDASPEHPALGFGLELRAEVIAELMLSPAAAAFARPTRATASPPAIAVGSASPRLLDAAVRMLRLLDNPADIPVLAPLIERELLWLVMSGDEGATVRQLGLADSGLVRVRHVVRWMRERIDEPVRVDALAERANMSPSAFHRAFQAVTAMSPIQFQKTLRLQEARLRLLAGSTDVSGAAFGVGYERPLQPHRARAAPRVPRPRRTGRRPRRPATAAAPAHGERARRCRDARALRRGLHRPRGAERRRTRHPRCPARQGARLTRSSPARVPTCQQ